MRLLCLLPVRNGEASLGAYLSAVASYCDGVIALDDGSTDDTRTILQASPLVKHVLCNPKRRSYAGWDDGRNRRRLLKACGSFRPDWVLWLDADEHLPPCDAVLLRPFLEAEARPDQAYGLEVLRLVGDRQHYDFGKLWAYRLIPFRADLTMPSARLHFDPVPVEIPRTGWRRTRLRIAHAGGITAADRRARRRKYLEADPAEEWQASYDNLLAPVGHIWPIRPLPPGRSLVID